MIQLKHVLASFIGLCVLFTLSLVAVVTLLDPNQLKGSLEEKINQKTGQQVSIHGPIFWQFDPGFSLELHDVSLNTHLKSKETFNAQKVRLEPRLWSLLSGKLGFDLEIDGLHIFIHRSIPSWQEIQAFFLPHFLAITHVVPYNIKIDNAILHWQDPFKKEQIEIKDVNFSATRLLSGFKGSRVPVSASFTLENVEKNEPYLFSFNAEWSLNHPSKQTKILAIQNVNLSFHSNHLSPTTTNGQIAIHFSENEPIAEGDFNILNLDLQSLTKLFQLPLASLLSTSSTITTKFKFQFPSLEVSSLNISAENNGKIESSFQASFESTPFKINHLTGKLQGKELLVNLFPLAELSTNIEFKEKILALTELKADFGHSLHQGKLKIDLRNVIPQLYLFDQISSLEVNDLLTSFGKKDVIRGRLQAEASFTTHGTTLTEWKNNLFGKTHLLITDGKIQGIELSPLLQHAQSTVANISDSLNKKQSINIEAVLTAELGEWKQQALGLDPLVTHFQLLETDFTVENGRLYTPDFKLLHPEYSVTGHGSINLNTEQIEYQALALLKNKNNIVSLPKTVASYLKKTPLSIQIHGSLNNLSLQPDLARYAHHALKLDLKHFSKEPKIPETEVMPEEGLEKLFGLP